MDTYEKTALILYYCSSIITASLTSAQTSIRSVDDVSDVNMSSSFSRDQTEDTSHTVMVFNEHQLNITENITDASPVNLQTTITLNNKLLPSTTQHPETTTIHPTSHRTETTTIHPISSASEIITSTQKSPAVVMSSPAQAEAHVDTPSALNVGDDDIYPKVSSDPLLAGLSSAFVIVAAVMSVLIFLKFRNRNDGPEFSRLQDLPMDDMMEDAPLY